MTLRQILKTKNSKLAKLNIKKLIKVEHVLKAEL